MLCQKITIMRNVVFAGVCCAGLLGCGGGGGDTSVPDSTGSSTTTNSSFPNPTTSSGKNQITSEGEAATFLMRATFGGTKAEIDSLNSQDAAEWLNDQFNRPHTSYLNRLISRAAEGEEISSDAHTYLLWDDMITNRAQLRQRTIFALSQLLVVSDNAPSGKPLQIVYYIDKLGENAFSNYRTILQDVTYSPHMAQFLTYFQNNKGDPEKGTMPDENYARELLQLFTIGLVELNMDGTPRLDANGAPVEVFTNEDIIGLARVFTGFAYKGTGYSTKDAADDAQYAPLQSFPERHSELEKTFLGLTIPAGTGPDDSVTMALDHIFAHPNVAPFISRQLIQRFTASNPAPEYVERVAEVFEQGEYTADNGRRFGDGQRGDMKAILAAILLDPSLFDEQLAAGEDFGKIREPILKFTHWARAFDVQNINSANEWRLRDARSPSDGLGQHPFRSPSVFNFYRPGYVAPGTESGTQNLTTPEFQLVNESTTIGYTNFMSEYALNRGSYRDDNIESFKAIYAEEIEMADNPVALMDHLDDLLTGGRMLPDRKTEFVDIIRTIEIDADPEEGAEDRESRVHTAVVLTLTSPAYAVLR